MAESSYISITSRESLSNLGVFQVDTSHLSRTYSTAEIGRHGDKLLFCSRKRVDEGKNEDGT